MSRARASEIPCSWHSLKYLGLALVLPCSFGVYFSLLPRPPLSTTPRSKRPCVFHVLIIPRIKAPEQFVSHSKAINYASNDFLILYLVSRELEEEAAFYSLPLLYIIIIFIIIPHSLSFFFPSLPVLQRLCLLALGLWHDQMVCS